MISKESSRVELYLPPSSDLYILWKNKQRKRTSNLIGIIFAGLYLAPP